MLGAAALGDIGKLFPDTDPALKVPTAASCYAKPGVVFRRRLYAGQRRCHYHRSGTEDVAAIPQMRVFIAEDLGCHMDDVT